MERQIILKNYRKTAKTANANSPRAGFEQDRHSLFPFTIADAGRRGNVGPIARPSIATNGNAPIGQTIVARLF
jgi:hypothetical protein